MNVGGEIAHFQIAVLYEFELLPRLLGYLCMFGMRREIGLPSK